MDKVKPTAFCTLSEKGSTAVKKQLKTMALVHCVYDVDFRIFGEEHELVQKRSSTEKWSLCCWILPVTLQGIVTQVLLSMMHSPLRT